MSKVALVAGASGLIGSCLLAELVKCGEYDMIKALVRKGTTISTQGITLLEVDFDHLDKYREDLQADAVFCCLGTTMKKARTREQFYKVDFIYPSVLGQIALENHSSQFHLISSIGANPKSLFYYSRVKGEIEQAISKLPMPNINIYRPSLLLGKRPEQRTGEQIGALFAKTLAPIILGPAKKYRAIEASVVARAMVKVSLQKLTGKQIFESDVISRMGSL
ncbi:MAG: NAD-dependent epimerase/dehydratase family protein [Cyclobacteriaceae bacterium]|nr:NAD-dependent epimerase/dehydratase family protein [Cyclobacteriaceae bacterium]